MGTIRVLLAISVVFSHLGINIFVGSKLAVQLFYIISGFLISYILVEKKSYSSIKNFYLNRFLRIFPIYWLVALITLILILLGNFFLNKNPFLLLIYSELDQIGKSIMFLVNIFLLGQDWIIFTCVKNNFFQFVLDATSCETKYWGLSALIIPQAWTIGVELTFYIIAPYILLRKKLLFFFLFLSILVRTYLISIDLVKGLWEYSFFSNELSLFLFGAFSHQTWTPFLKKNNFLTRKRSILITFLIFIYCIIFSLLPYQTFNYLFLIFAFILSLPFLFYMQNQNYWDKKIGDLSYPIYISHFTFIWIFKNLFDKFFQLKYNLATGSLLIIMTIIFFSFFINYFLDNKIQKFRNKFKV
jgi:peptidoglycan/LPS O-acetylase OafA/YrhL